MYQGNVLIHPNMCNLALHRGYVTLPFILQEAFSKDHAQNVGINTK